jgi:hypothetical protein
VAEEDNGRLPGPAQGQQRPEIGVGGDEYAGFVCRQGEEFSVVGVLKLPGADMDGIMAMQAQSLGNDGRERVVDEKLHA